MKPLVLAFALALAGCSSTADTRGGGSSRAAGSFCGSYAGSKAGSGSGAQDVVREARCFRSLAACRAWFDDLQNRAPAAFVRKPCR